MVLTIKITCGAVDKDGFCTGLPSSSSGGGASLGVPSLSSNSAADYKADAWLNVGNKSATYTPHVTSLGSSSSSSLPGGYVGVAESHSSLHSHAGIGINTGHNQPYVAPNVPSVSSGNSYTHNSNSSGLSKDYKYQEVLGTPDDTARNHNGHSATTGYIIDFCRKQSGHCWGSNALDHVAGGAEGAFHTKAINLARAGLDDNDMANLFYVLRDFNFNLDIINVPDNNFGNPGVVSMISGITGLNHQTLYKAPEWKPYAGDKYTVQNVTILNLSNNHIGDPAAKTIADAIVSKKLHAKAIDISYNKDVTKIGWEYLANALKSSAVEFIAITLEVHKGQKAVADFLKKGSSYYFKEFVKSFKGNIDTKYIKTDEDSAFMHCKEGVPKAVVGVTLGVAKCTNPIAKIINSLPQPGEKIPFVTKAVNKLGLFACVMSEEGDNIVTPDLIGCIGEATAWFNGNE